MANQRPLPVRTSTGQRRRARLHACVLALLATTIAAVPGDEAAGPVVHAFRNHQPLAASAVHLDIVRSMVESELGDTVNLAMAEPLPDKPSVSLVWPYTHTVTIHADAGDSEVEMVALELHDFGPGPGDLGDILIVCRDAAGARYRCEKYSPTFCDSVHAIVRYQIAK